MRVVLNLGRKIISSFWGIVFHIRNIILLGSATQKTPLNSDYSCEGEVLKAF